MGILCVFSEMLRNNKDAYSSTLGHGVRRGKCDASGSYSQVSYIAIPCRGRRTLGRIARDALRRTCHIVGVVVAVWFLLPSPSRGDLVEHGPKDAAPSGLLAGVARADITPPVGIAQMNWGSQTHIEAVGIDPVGMVATALVISDGKQKFVMVDVDRLYVQGLEPAIERASELTGIPAAHIRLGASHTHSGPFLSAQKGPADIDLSQYQSVILRHRDQVVDKIVGAIVEANSKLRPVHIYAGRGTGTININRRFRSQGNTPPAVGRNPKGFVDRELVVVRIDDEEGKPYAILANFQCHGTVLGHENKFISPDWIGTTRRVVEQAFPGALCLFFQGAAGNQGPVEGFTGDLRVAHRLGSILAHEIAAVTLGVETVERVPTFEGFVESTAYQAKQPWRVKGPRDAIMKFASKTILLPRRTYTAKELIEMEARIADAKKKVEMAKKRDDPWKQQQANAQLRRFSDLMKQWKRPVESTPAKIEVQVLRIGNVAIVALPGEPFAEIGAAVKKASPFAFTMFCGYSSGIGGDYLPVRSEYQHGGYEVERTPYGMGAAEKLTRETIRLFEEVK